MTDDILAGLRGLEADAGIGGGDGDASDSDVDLDIASSDADIFGYGTEFETADVADIPTDAALDGNLTRLYRAPAPTYARPEAPQPAAEPIQPVVFESIQQAAQPTSGDYLWGTTVDLRESKMRMMKFFKTFTREGDTEPFYLHMLDEVHFVSTERSSQTS